MVVDLLVPHVLDQGCKLWYFALENGVLAGVNVIRPKLAGLVHTDELFEVSALNSRKRRLGSGENATGSVGDGRRCCGHCVCLRAGVGLNMDRRRMG